MNKKDKKLLGIKAAEIFEKEGLSKEDAALITEILSDAEMKGLKTHGYVRVKKYVDCIRRVC